MNYPKNPLIACRNINSLRNKIIDLGDIMSYLYPGYLVLSETKLDDNFPSAQSAYQTTKFELDVIDIRMEVA